ncbi:Ppx/GppA phosphatase family-domain-containing protein [Gigaspora rosea]|uniref:Ppx/GppA phosphatase family-domain-containing protein n=1 Tax=Gigaspora rosea TaxID=44941 RepID=A0A397U2S4_9GLOM|nr:Ppx/GppA phosphatase family-domain-containing protein [Gigaspora rosea]
MGDEGIGIVDIGSNGIRFGLVSSLSRHLPVIYEERAPISLLEAQNSDTGKVPIPDKVIDDVIDSLKRFKLLAQQYKIKNVKIVATEATRSAPNSKEFKSKILDATGWEIKELSKADEAEISAMGIIATYFGVEGLVMDMGGGSVELNYIINRPGESEFQKSNSPINLPYGATELKNRLSKEKPHKIFKEIKDKLEESFKNLIPPENIKDKSGYDVYMCGGGLRSLGYLSMSDFESETSKSSKQKATYPIPIINGYGISAKELAGITKRFVPSHDSSASEYEPSVKKLFPNGTPFRIGNRRAELIPASCFFLEALMEVIPLRYVYFCEGGVRQGSCFNIMPESERKKDPFDTFISSHPLQPKYITDKYRDKLVDIIKAALPSVFYDVLDSDELVTETTTKRRPRRLERLLPSLVYLAHWSMSLAKESRPIYAFYLPLSGGALCNAPGITHVDRAIISWCLMYRHYDDSSGDGVEDDVSDIASTMFYSIKKMIPGGKDGRKVCEIIGKFLGFLILCRPINFEQNEGIGISGCDEPSIEFNVHEDDQDNKKTYNIGLSLTTKMGVQTEHSSSQKTPLIKNPIVNKSRKKLEKSFSLGHKIKKGDKKDDKKNGYPRSDINIKILF